MYKIIGADQKEYGPISTDQIRQWISEGRVNGQTLVCAEGSQDWKPLAVFPEFGFTAAPMSSALPASAPDVLLTPEEILAGDYSLDIMSCFSRGWALFKNNFATLFVSVLVMLVLAFAVGGASQIVLKIVGVSDLPLVTQTYLKPVFVIFGVLVMGPIGGGLCYIFLSSIRGRLTSVGDLFLGFKTFQDLFLGKLIPTLLATACTMPASITYATKMGPIIENLKQNPPNGGDPMQIFGPMISAFTASLPMMLICMIPATYLFVNFVFTPALIIDKQIGFWKGLTVSWRIAHKHWFQVFGIVVLVSLLNFVGACLCLVGLLVTVPFGLATVMYAYEDIFSRKKA